MASNINLIVILMLAFYASNGSLLLTRQGRACLTARESPHTERHQYRQSRVPKRSVDPDEEEEAARAVDGWLPTSPARNTDGLPLPAELLRRAKSDHETGRYQVPWRKRNQPDVHAGGGTHGSKSPAEMLTQRLTSQFVFRSPRGHRQYDVPQIECPQAEDGMDRFACPTPDRMGRYRCIDDHVLCDGFIDCPNGEDEDRQACMFYKTTKAHLDVLADAVLRWARGR